MFIDTQIALISDETIEGTKTLSSLGIEGKLDPDEFQFKPLRFRIEDIKYVYQSLYDGILVLELYDTEGNFMLKDTMVRITELMDDYYATKG